VRLEKGPVCLWRPYTLPFPENGKGEEKGTRARSLSAILKGGGEAMFIHVVVETYPRGQEKRRTILLTKKGKGIKKREKKGQPNCIPSRPRGEKKGEKSRPYA